jgi:acylphosphatase
MAQQQAHVWISGRVQGVFFRSNTQEEAQRRGLQGWVRNLPDGRVEAVFQGEESSVQEMIRWCQAGSSFSRVDDVEVRWEEPETGLNDFRIRYGS